MTGTPTPPLRESVAAMRAFDDLVRLNPRLGKLIQEAELDTAEQLNILRQNAREKAAFDFFNDRAGGESLLKETLVLERALQNYLKQYPPLTRRARHGKL